MNLLKYLSAVVVVLAVASMSQAALLNVTNASFESPVETDGNYSNLNNGQADLPGWIYWNAVQNLPVSVTLGGNTNDMGTRNYSGQFTGDSGQGALPAPAAGPQALYVNGHAISQTLTDTVQANMIYTLSVAIGHRGDSRGTITDGLVQLWAGSTMIASYANLNPETYTPAFTFKDLAISYTSTASDPLIGQPLRIEIGRLGVVSISSYLAMDNVRLDATPVPEPATLALLGTGVLALIRRRR